MSFIFEGNGRPYLYRFDIWVDTVLLCLMYSRAIDCTELGFGKLMIFGALVTRSKKTDDASQSEDSR